MAGKPSANWFVSLTRATSAASSALWATTNASRFSLPISSSPSISSVTLTGTPPWACQAVSASTWAQTCPLSSTAPRA